MTLKFYSLIFLFITITNCQNNSSSTNSTNITSSSNLVSPGDSAIIIISSILVMIMTPAVGHFYGGLVKTKNMISILAQTFAIYSIITLLWTFIGFSIAFGGSNRSVWGDLGNFSLNNVNYDPNPNYGKTIPFLLFFFFQTQFAVISPALIIGSTAERVKFLPICIFSSIWSLLIYSPICHWNWNINGWLNLLGSKDFAGGNCIHIAAGVSAMAVVLIIRDEIHQDPTLEKKKIEERKKDFDFINNRPKLDSLDTKEMYIKSAEIEDTQNSVIFLVIGTMLLWFGWFGFNGGSALVAERSAILALVNTNVAPSVALLVWVLLDLKYKKRPTVTGMCIAVVSGLVGITPACGFVRVWASVVIGAGSAVFPYIFTRIRDKYQLFDDRLDVFGCHGIAGIWGGFCVGLFLCDIRLDNTCDPNIIGAVYGNGMQIVYQLFGIISTGVYSFVGSTIIMYFLKKTMSITVDKRLLSQGMDNIEFREIAIARTRINQRKSELKIGKFYNNEDFKKDKKSIEKQNHIDVLDTDKIFYPNEKNIDQIVSVSLQKQGDSII